jgi:hypothetical protein
MRQNIMIHYFITWFEYHDHHGKCIRHVYVGGMKLEYQKQKVQRESSFLSHGGVILGTCYLILITKYKRI